MLQMQTEYSQTVAEHFAHAEERFFNRELSWLQFNTRVMEEAENPNNPLLERVKFLSISANNLDEFYMVRVAGLKDQIAMGIDEMSIDGLNPQQQLDRITTEASKLMQAQQACWMELRGELAKQQIRVLDKDALTESERLWLEGYFRKEIFPVLTPIAIDPAHPFPFIANLGMVLLFELQRPDSKRPLTALVAMPSKLPRFIKIKKGKKNRFMLLEDVIKLHLDTLFNGFECVNSGMFRIVRDSDLEVDDEAEDLVRQFEKAVKERRRGRVVRLKVTADTPDHLVQFMCENLPASLSEAVAVEGMLGLGQLGELYKIHHADLKYSPFEVRFPERIRDFGGDCFAAIQAKDIVVHHPYESFDVVVQFLRQAADDPDVVSIKQTLYRTSHNSPIVKALMRAAENGKSVTALVELKARFDEEANMRWARDMERAGVQVVFGFVKLKTHAKMSLVTRRVDGELRSYAHFGTGNYHPITAKIYTDLSFFTSDPALCEDAAYLFNFITGYTRPERFNKIAAAPHSLRQTILQHIEEEIAFARAGKPASIWAKMNALIDAEIIDALYMASQAGVQIDLVVRGICGLRPGIPGFSENIRVKSIVGRFLEHARIYCFGNGEPLPSREAKVYIASADWMVRNFDHRVEIMMPVENPTVHAQVLDQIMLANMRDEQNSWMLNPDGSYTRSEAGEEAFGAHQYFMNNPSLSGRGKALRKTKRASKKTKTMPKSDDYPSLVKPD